MNSNDLLEVKGLAGEKKLSGDIEIKGAKNAALKAMAASFLFDGEVELKNMPDNADINTLINILTKLGSVVKWDKESGNMKISSPSHSKGEVDSEMARVMRASVVLTGPLLGRYGQVTFPAPGGCVIGTRPIDLFLEGYAKMGAKIELSDKLYHIKTNGHLKGSEIFFHLQSVGGTETLMMAAVMAEGRTVLKNCAMEPEIVNLAEWLVECGADIKGAGTTTITVEGTKGKLLNPTKPFVTIPDRIEAGSYLILGALCAKDLTIQNCNPKHMEAVIHLLKDSGVPIGIKENSIEIKDNHKHNSSLKGFNLRTHEYPGFPTDLQSPIATYLTQVTGESTIFETIFEGRFAFMADLQKMGADVTVMNTREVLVKGPSELFELPDEEYLNAHDIRAGFAILIAAIVGRGKFLINNVHFIDRGYERVEENLRSIGVEINRIKK